MNRNESAENPTFFKKVVAFGEFAAVETRYSGSGVTSDARIPYD